MLIIIRQQRFIPVFVFILLSLTVHSQNDTLFFWHHDMHERMTNNNISGIAQDSLGYMWYSTHEGLNKYDGYGFKPYLHDPRNNNSLSSDDITCMITGSDGIIWIGTAGKGLNKYDTYSGKWTLFEHHPNDLNSLSQDSITCIYSDSSGLIWIGTASHGLDAFNPQTKSFKHFNCFETADHSISDNHITCLASSQKNILWIGTRHGGINKFEFSGNKVSSLKTITAKQSGISSNDVREIYADASSKKIWIATAFGLDLFDPATNRFTIFLHEEKNPFSISSNDVTCVFKDKYDKIWAGTAANGVNVYYAKQNIFQRYNHDAGQKNSLNSNHINSISQGRSGMMWIATDKGLNAFNPQPLRFTLCNPFDKKYDHPHADCIIDMVQTHDQDWWMATCDDGVTEYNPSLRAAHTFTHQENNITSLSSDVTTCEMVDYHGNIWVGTTSGLNTIDAITKKVTRIRFANEDLSSLAANRITALLQTKAGKILMGTSGGLFVYTPAVNEGTLLTLSKIAEHCSITALAQDSSGMIWIGTTNGLATLNSQFAHLNIYRHNPIDPHSVGSNYINSIYCDVSGKIWIGTLEGGLNLYVKKTGGFVSYTSADGLPGNSVYHILEDGHSQLWIGTNAGICKLKFNGAKLEACIYDELDGLPTLQFSKSASIRSSNGRMLFSCVDGIIIMNPDSVTSNLKKPPVIITDFFLFNKEVLPGSDDSILATSVSRTDHIRLKHNQNTFSFQFTAVSFINPEKNSYAYKLDGLDKDSAWNYTDARHRVASYTSLDPGTYIFRVKASNNDGIWNEKGRMIHIIIDPPFWRTWWFYCISFLVLTGILYSIYKFRLNQVLKFQSVRNKIASDLHDDVGSTLSSIAIYSELANAEVNGTSAKASSLLLSINENARITIDSMSDIVWAINPKNDRFENLLARMRTLASAILEAKNIDLRFDSSATLSILKLTMEKRKNIYLIFKEMINNVVKYSDGKNCTVRLWLSGKMLNMEVTDDGHGFDMNNCNSGNGLTNMKRRSNEMHGSLKIESSKSGTSVHLACPAN